MDDLKAKKITVLKAVKTLKKITDAFISDPSKKKLLLEDANEQAVFLHVTLKKIPPLKNVKIIKVPLPFSLLKDTSEVCLLAGDLDQKNRKAEIEPDILHYKNLLKKHDISQITEVMTLRQLRTEYKNHEAKRQLLAAYDIFLADSTIVGVLHSFLGKFFYKKRKLPIQIEMKSSKLKNQVNRALSLAVFLLTTHGNTFSSEVAHLKMEVKDITRNILAVIKTLVENIPGKWKNIMGMYIKTAKSKSIPIYMSFENPSDVHLKKPKRKEFVKAEELSTLPNAKVKVFRDGNILIQREKGNSRKSESTRKRNKRKFKEGQLNDSGSLKRKRMKKENRNSFENISDGSKIEYLSGSEENAESNVLLKNTPVKIEEVVENESIVSNDFSTMNNVSINNIPNNKISVMSNKEKKQSKTKASKKKRNKISNESLPVQDLELKKNKRNSKPNKEIPVKKKKVVENESIVCNEMLNKVKEQSKTKVSKKKQNEISNESLRVDNLGLIKNKRNSKPSKGIPVKKKKVVENEIRVMSNKVKERSKSKASKKKLNKIF